MSNKHAPKYVVLLLLCLSMLLGFSSLTTAQDGGLIPLPAAGSQNEQQQERSGLVQIEPAFSLREVLNSAPQLPDGRILVVVNLSDQPAVMAYINAGGETAGRPARRAAIAQRRVVAAAQSQFMANAATLGAESLGTTNYLTNTVSLAVHPNNLVALSQLPGVTGVYADYLVTRSDTVSVPYIGAPAAWAGDGDVNTPDEFTGEGMVVAIMDSGVDYSHKHFGGDGSYPTDRTTLTDGDPFGTFPPTLGAQKVVGGWDFVGDAFTGGSSDQVPDPDPIDCQITAGGGHGTHVAGTAAGYGVEADGDTYTGPLNQSIFTSYPAASPSAFLIGPGVAPRAAIVALKVFGCDGSTLSTVMARGIDAAASGQVVDSTDSDGDQDFTEVLATFPPADVLNMSIGAPFGTADPNFVYNLAATNATLAGTVVVTSTGNNGFIHFIASSPGQTNEVIATAWMHDPSDASNSLQLNTPTPSTLAATYGAGSPFPHTPVTTTLIRSDPLNGCTAFNNAAAVAGKIVLIDRGSCDFSVKQNFAFDAGAAGVIVANVSTSAQNSIAPFMAASTRPGYNIPTVAVNFANGEILRAAVATDPTVTVTLDAYQFFYANDIAPGGLSTSSSRGPSRNSLGSFKPDIAAPGQSILSAGSGAGQYGYVIQGTSMASPHIAGTMALLKQKYPTWSVAELKALVMNTATNNVTNSTGNNIGTLTHGPQSVGAGRVDVPNAFSNEVIAYNKDNPRGVSVMFGFPEVVSGTTLDSMNLTRTVEVQNKSATPATYDVSFATFTNMLGVQFTVSPSTITVAPNATVDVTVTLTGNPNIANVHTNSDPTLPTASRHRLTEESGYVVLTPTSGATEILRVPVYAAPSINSAMQATDVVSTLGAAITEFDIELTGTPVSTGGVNSTNINSFVSTYQLVTTDPEEAGVSDNADIRYIGITDDFRTAPAPSSSEWGGIVYFAIATHGDWNTLNENELRIEVDVDGDGVSDMAVQNGSPATSLDNFQVAIDDYSGAFFGAPGLWTFGMSINYFSSSLNTYLFNNNVLVLPVPFEDLGIPQGTTIKFWATGADGYTAGVDTVGSAASPFTYTIGKPAYDFFNFGTPNAYDGLPVFLDAPSTLSFVSNLVPSAEAPDILLIHHHNTSATTAEVVDMSLATGLAFNLLTPATGTALTAVPEPLVITWEVPTIVPDSYTFVLDRPDALADTPLVNLTAAADTDGLECTATVCTLTVADADSIVSLNGTYSWLVYANNSAGQTPANAAFTFTVDVAPPSAFTVTSPRNGTVIGDSATVNTLTWSASTAPVAETRNGLYDVKYNLDLFKISSGARSQVGQIIDANGLTSVADSDALTCTATLCTYTLTTAQETALSRGRYLWTVAAVNAFDPNETVEASNAPFEFRIRPEDLVSTIMRNGSFEVAGATAVQAADWNGFNITGDGRVCTGVVAEGTCAFRFVGGAGETSRIQQANSIEAFNLAGGDTVTFNFSTRAGGTPVLRVRLIIVYEDNTSEFVVTTVNTTSTGYVAGSTSVILDKKPITARVQITNRSTAGNVFIDNVSLTYTRATPPSVEGNSTGEIALPEAPSN